MPNLNQLTPAGRTIAAMSEEEIERIADLEAFVAQFPQVDIETDHVLHAGMYARTITIPAGVVLSGALIRVATVLIVNGDTEVVLGSESKRLTGYNVIPASAGRKQAFYTYSDTQVTMIFPTKATTVEQAEDEFTEEAHKLMSRRQGRNHYRGEMLCQEQ